jgi:hypothetical protein
VRIAPDGRSFATTDGVPFVPWGVNYYRPGTGWAPQVWQQFDAESTRRDFARLRELGANCVRVFLTFGSFYAERGRLAPEGLEKFDQFLALAEEAGLYVHPTGPDHWEGVPEWARTDRIADERVLEALETFWRLFAARYRGRSVLFAYDLLNEPQVAWDTPALRDKWRAWLAREYVTEEQLATAWQRPGDAVSFGSAPVPPKQDASGSRPLLDYQRFREEIADTWTRRQVAAIKSADPDALVTVGLIQWSVPSVLGGPSQYSAFRPERQARFLDFLEVHFYPLAAGAYEYRGEADEQENLAYLECVAAEVARPGKPVVLAEFGWYGGGPPTFDNGRHPPATEEQQARWCQQVVTTSAGLAVGWLNWGFHDHPQARDVSQLTGLLTVEGQLKAWGRTFQRLGAQFNHQAIAPKRLGTRPSLDWEACVTSGEARTRFREAYRRAYMAERP